MELSLEAFQTLLSPGLNLGALVLFLFYLYRKDVESEKRQLALAVESQARESRLGERINNLEDYQRNKITTIAEASAAALSETARSLQQLDMSMRRLPCFLTGGQPASKNVAAREG